MAQESGGKRNIDERIDALTMNLELLSHSVQKLVEVTNEDATALRTLARIAEAHEARIADLENGPR